jgi:septal ring factor EnvC (AmiA/AmiB activator)
MPDVYPNIQGLNRVRRKSALRTKLLRLEDQRRHLERVLDADKALLERHKARMAGHKQELDALVDDARVLSDRIRAIENQERLEAGDAVEG